uniref:Alpha/beta hydrolase n=1 Tax=Prymnesium polylepis TaxID=72548 RepID=A0A7S4KAU3_9EUKA
MRAIIFGGLKMGPRVLSKFADIYSRRGVETSFVPLNFVSVLARDPAKHGLYGKIRKTMEQEEAVHLHVLSGACHVVTNLFELHPDLKEKVVSQIYDSPCHINGMAPALKEFYGVPPALTRHFTAALFPDCLRTSERFMEAPVIQRVRTGVIYSERDVISPLGPIETMMDAWSDSVKLYPMKTRSKHLLHMRDEPDRYEGIVDDVLQLTPIVSGDGAAELHAVPAA